MKKDSFLLLIVILIIVIPMHAVCETSDRALVLGYYPAWVKNSFPADKVDFTILTHVIHAFAWPEKDGTIAVWEDFYYPELVEATHRAGRKISVAFGGWGNCEGFPPVAADPELRAVFIRNSIEFCKKHGYDGIDLDWEFPANPEERDNLTTLVYELREALDSIDKPMLLTMAISAGTWSGDHNDYSKLTEKIDWFNNMTYDFYGPWNNIAGHNAPLYASQESVNTSIEFLMRRHKIPPEKILMGVPFYGRRFRASWLYGPSTGGEGIVYRDIAKLLNSGGWKYNWDDVSMVPYLTNDAGTEMVFFDDPESIGNKCVYARERNLRGVMIWSLGSDYMDGGQPLLDAIGRNIR